MSIHVCKCERNGQPEWHLRYPGMSEEAAQELADKINSGALRAQPPTREALGLLQELEPHLDKLICYASTTTEYPVNGLIHRVYEFLHKIKTAPEPL